MNFKFYIAFAIFLYFYTSLNEVNARGIEINQIYKNVVEYFTKKSEENPDQRNVNIVVNLHGINVIT